MYRYNTIQYNNHNHKNKRKQSVLAAALSTCIALSCRVVQFPHSVLAVLKNTRSLNYKETLYTDGQLPQHAYTHAHTYTCMHTYMRAYIHSMYVYACIHTYTYIHSYKYMSACLPA